MAALTYWDADTISQLSITDTLWRAVDFESCVCVRVPVCVSVCQCMVFEICVSVSCKGFGNKSVLLPDDCFYPSSWHIGSAWKIAHFSIIGDLTLIGGD